MAIFCLKKIAKPLRIGEILKCRRKEKNITLKQVCDLSRIPKKYIIALEKNKYKNLPPAKSHCVGYVHKYAEILQLNCQEIVKQFIEESDLINYQTIHPLCWLKIKPINPIVIWVRRLSLALALIFFIGYLIWQINGILQPPRLTVFSPAEGYINNGIKLLVQGETEKEVTLQINGSTININNQGKFETFINLSKGVNTITISATKKHGKTTTITRNVVMKDDSARVKNILTLDN